MTPNLILTRLNDLEAVLYRYSIQELNVADATRLKRAFLDFKDRVIARLYTRGDLVFLSTLFQDPESTFTLLQDESSDPRHHAVTNTQWNVDKGRQVMLAEHDPRVASFFIKHLQGAGFEVLWASHEAMAKRMLQNGNPDAVICSVYSRRGFGKEVLASIRKPGNRHIPVLLVGGEKHCEALRDAIQLGADDYMAHHITAAEIIGKVGQLIR